MHVKFRMVVLMVAVWCGGAFVSDALAQQSDDGVDSFTTEDVYPDGRIESGADLDGFWDRIYLELGKNPSVSRDEIEALKARIESGGSIDFAARISLGADSSVQSMAVERNSGFVGLDSLFGEGSRMFQQGSVRLGKEFEGLSEIALESSVTKTQIFLRGTITARSTDRAAGLVRLVESLKSSPSNDVNARLASAVSVRRDGATVVIEGAWPISVLISSVR